MLKDLVVLVNVHGYSPTEINSIAIEQLKLEVVNRGGNGYWIESCKDFTSD